MLETRPGFEREFTDWRNFVGRGVVVSAQQCKRREEAARVGPDESRAHWSGLCSTFSGAVG